MLGYDREKLLRGVRENEKNQIECAEKFIAVPTCYGKQHDMKPMIQLLTEEFEKREYKVQVFPTAGSSILVAEMNVGAEKTLMFYNHYDVQPEEPVDEWKSPPYNLSIRNERLYGRGISDNKGPLIANIFGVQTALEAQGTINCNVRFVVEGEEEAGSPHLEEFCKTRLDLLKSNGCVWEAASAAPKQTSEIYAGVKGDVYYELRARGFSKDAHSGDAPVVVNPAWRLVWALSTLKNKNEEILMDGFYKDVVPPQKEELALFAKYPPEKIEEYKKLYNTDRFLLEREGVEFWKQLILRPTCTISGLLAGYTGAGTKTVIGKEAMAKLDIRIVPDQKVDKISEMLRKHLDKHGFQDIEAKFMAGYEPSRTPINNPFIKLLTSIAKDFSSMEPVLFPSSPGSGPAYLFGAHTPWASCGTFDPESNVHAPNESMRIEDFRCMTAFIAAIAIELGR
jgi:acetylornithine deacetylase/succinyl-diaminopimelate desuccinylase-like protein